MGRINDTSENRIERKVHGERIAFAAMNEQRTIYFNTLLIDALDCLFQTPSKLHRAREREREDGKEKETVFSFMWKKNKVKLKKNVIPISGEWTKRLRTFSSSVAARMH